ncbi:NAD(P)-dependent oxidoreductase, partial [Streptomyces sp. NPDC059814]
HPVVHASPDTPRLWWPPPPPRPPGTPAWDDSEPYAAKLIAEQGELDPANPDHAHLGGHFCTNPPIWPH